MELPGYSMAQWAEENNLQHLLPANERIQRSVIANYYVDYVSKVGIEKNFLNFSTVTCLSRMSTELKSGYCACGFLQKLKNTFLTSSCICQDCSEYRWCLKVQKTLPNGTTEQIYIRAKNVVIASGMFDVPKRLHFPGEELPLVSHSAKDIDNFHLSKDSTENEKCSPVLVIGSGLSAADAILHLRSKGVSVFHIYWNQKGLFSFF